jgi:hypothetical protein
MARKRMPKLVNDYASAERAVRAWVENGELDRAIAFCEKAIRRLPKSAYHQAVGRSFLHQTGECAKWLAKFFKSAQKSHTVRSLYCEMNRFEINPDRWYIDGFAYEFIGDTSDFGWLCGWKKATGESCFVLKGMEDLQRLFERDLECECSAQSQTPSEFAILLLTLRMQQLVNTAARLARRNGGLPVELPVFSTAHDSDLISTSACSGGVVVSPEYLTALEPPTSPPSYPACSTKQGVYCVDHGWDQFRNSIQWDVLDYTSAREEDKCTDLLRQDKPLTRTWPAPRVKLRRRRFRCDLVQIYPHWAVNAKAKNALSDLLRKTVEFLPLKTPTSEHYHVMHLLQRIDLGPKARIVKDGPGQDDLIMEVMRYSFNADDLVGKHFFLINRAFCKNLMVSEDFKRAYDQTGLRGLVFERVFTYCRPEK